MTLSRQIAALAVALLACVFTAPRARAIALTFAKDIAPVVYAHCATCHREGEAAPFPLLSYNDVKKRAAQIVKVTASGYMPPWKAVPADDAKPLEFVGQRHLTPVQVALFKEWLDTGCTPGDLASVPPIPKFPVGWRLGTPDLIVKMPEGYKIPADGRDIYRCFVVPVTPPAGKYLRAVEFRPGNRRVVHHGVLTTLAKEEVARRLAADGDSTGPGFKTGLAAPGDRLPGSLGLWVPGMDPFPLPEGYAMPWPANCELVLQLHLHPSGKPEVEQSSVGLYFTSDRPRGGLRALTAFNPHVDIAAGDAGYTLNHSLTVKNDVQVIGLFPHMHLLGRTVQATATLPDGSKRSLLKINDWDFNWQGYYQYAAPLKLPAGTRIETVWTFDNSAENPRNPSSPPRRVTFGEQTTDEMGALVLDVIPSRKANPQKPPTHP